MKFEDYTKPQQKAITTEGNVIVSAGAGSGKTQVLTERVKYFVKNKGYKLDEFLILTFTNLAAGEMKDRIRKALTDEGLDAANYVDTADICTFDSYALSIVKKYHFMLNVSPNISIVDSNIISVRKRTIIEDIFEELYKQENPEFLKMIDRFCFKDDKELKELVLKIYDKALLSNDTDSYINNYIENYYNDNLINDMILKAIDIIKDERKNILEKLNLVTERPCSKKDPRPFRQAVETVLSDFFEANTYNELVNALPEKLGVRSPSGMDEDEKENNQTFLKLYKKMSTLIQSFPDSEVSFKEFVLSNVEYAKVLLNVVKELDSKIKAYKDKYQVYEFNDIAKLALNLVRTNEEVRNTIKNKLKMIMIDEYQDTSSLQEAFINEIGNNNVYMVGDVKQSIYRFRNARCDIFIDKYEKYKAGIDGTAIDLNTNFRSRKEVLSDINYIFENLMTKEYGGADYRKDHIIEFGNTKYIKEGYVDTNNHSTFIFHNKHGEDAPVEEANIIARDIIDKINNHYQVLGKDGLRDCKFSDFCILMDRGSEFDTYAKVFTEYHLPLYVENDENISECDIVLILINILKLIKAINDNDYKSIEFRKAFLSVARSFLYNYTDDELLQICDNNTFENDKIVSSIKDVLFKYKTYPLAKQFEQIIFGLDIYNELIYSGEVTKNEKYLDMFLNMFSEMSKLDYSLEDFIIYMENIDTYDLKITLSSVGSSIDSIKIMNIHKSKGLEFNIIYYAGLYKGFNQTEYRSSFGVSNKYGLILKPEHDEDSNIIQIINNKYEYKEDISERIRLFYVALTRAKEKMIFVVRDDMYHQELIDIINENLVDQFIEDYQLDSKHIREIAEDAINGYLNGELNKKAYLDILHEYSIPTPNSYEYLLSPNFNVNKDELINECNELDNMLMKYESRMLDKKEVIIYLYSLLANNEITDIEFNYALDKYNMKLINVDDKLDEENNPVLEITRDDIVDINEDSNKQIKYYDLISERLENYINGILTTNEFIDLMKFLGYEINEKYLEVSEDELNEIDLDELINNLIVNKIYSVDYEEDSKMLSEKIEQLEGKDYCYYNYLVTLDYANGEEIRNILNFININKDYEFNLDLYEYLFKKLGYTITNKTKEYIVKLYKNVSDSEAEEFNNLDFFDKFVPLINVKDIVSTFNIDDLFKSFLEDYQNYNISIEDFNYLLGIFNYELDIDFINANDEYQTNIDKDYIMDIINIKNVEVEDISKAKCFNNFIIDFVNNPIFELSVIDTTSKKPELNIKVKEVQNEKLEVKEVNVETVEQEIFRASKKLDLTASKKNMDFGTKMHFIMEVTDFVNPDYEAIGDEFKINVVKKFLASPLLKNVKDAGIYKEYEFFDEVNSTNGIIDLMLVYKDHIDIIDYKTKNIDDESYDKQLKIYADFVKTKFALPINTYLYSLLTGEYRKCN